MAVGSNHRLKYNVVFTLHSSHRIYVHTMLEVRCPEALDAKSLGLP